MLNLAILGLNHKTAPVAVREKLAFPESSLPDALRRLKGVAGVEEGLILSTCNRVEVVVSGAPQAELNGNLGSFLSGYHGIPAGDLTPHLYAHHQRDAIRHLFRVAASLDSMLVGEPQILGQVKTAWAAARAAGTLGGPLDEAMMRAFTVAKKVRSETGIAQSAVSVSFAAVELARKIFGTLAGKTVLLIGAGKMSELAARHLMENGAAAMLVTNRSAERAAVMAESFHARAIPFDALFDHLAQADIVISSTGAPHFILKKDDGPRILARRKNRPMFLIDIAVPRDIDPALNDLDNLFVYDIDDLREVIHANLKEREDEALLAEQIVEQEVDRFLERLRTADVVPTIISLQERLEDIRSKELDRLRGRFGELSPEQEAALEQLTRGIVNKVLHQPITELKAEKSPGFVEVVRRVFGLK